MLQLLEDEADWRAFDHHQAEGNKVRQPKVPRPPVIRGILHNAFRDQIKENQGEIEDLLGAAAPVFFATGVPKLVEVATELQNIALSIPEALKVSRLSAKDALCIPVNRLPGKKGQPKLLYFRDKVESFKVGGMKFTIIGPSERDLDDLRKGWNHWLRIKKNELQKTRAQLKRRIEEFSAGANSASPFDLRDWNGIPDYKGVPHPMWRH